MSVDEEAMRFVEERTDWLATILGYTLMRRCEKHGMAEAVEGGDAGADAVHGGGAGHVDRGRDSLEEGEG